MSYAERIAGMLDKTFAWSVTRTFSRAEAEELTQEVLFQALKSVGELRDGHKFEPWFWRLAGITLKVFRRGQAKRRGVMSINEVSAPVFEDEYDFEADAELQNLRRGIAEMSVVYREIIVMHYYDGLSCKVIAQKLGLPEGTVTYRLSAARNKLKERCVQMNETALKPMPLKIRISGDGNYNGDSQPFPWQYIDDALSQNILRHAYRNPKSVEELSALTGVPAFYIEDRIQNLIRREAVIQPTKMAVQTDFLIFDEKINAYAQEHTGEVVAAVSKKFYPLSRRVTERVLSAGLQTAGRSFDEILCLLSVMLLDKSVPDHRPSEFKKIRQKYDGGRWEYMGYVPDKLPAWEIGIGIEKTMNTYEKGTLAHYTYHFAPFEYRKMMFDHEKAVCHAVLYNIELTEKQKEYAAEMAAAGYLARNEAGEVTCAIPVFTQEQYDIYLAGVKEIFADFLPFYSAQIKKYLDGYLKLFPPHLKDAAGRNGFYVFTAMFKDIAADWLRDGRISIPGGAVCDTLIMM